MQIIPKLVFIVFICELSLSSVYAMERDDYTSEEQSVEIGDNVSESEARLLLELAAPNRKNAATNELLRRLGKGCRYSVVDALIKAGADVNAQNSRGNTPLHIALKKVRPKTISLLLESHADIHLENDEGQSPWKIVFGNQERYKKIFYMFNLIYQDAFESEDELAVDFDLQK